MNTQATTPTNAAEREFLSLFLQVKPEDRPAVLKELAEIAKSATNN